MQKYLVGICSSNCTFMELKSVHCCQHSRWIIGSNCTFMELKYVFDGIVFGIREFKLYLYGIEIRNKL